MAKGIDEMLDDLANIDPDEYIAQQSLFEVDGVTFEVLGKVRAIRRDGKVVDTIAGPVVLTRTDSLYQAMLVLAVACTIEEFQLEPEELLVAASEIASELNAGKHKWTKPRS